jgi:hypothetical protein
MTSHFIDVDFPMQKAYQDFLSKLSSEDRGIVKDAIEEAKSSVLRDASSTTLLFCERLGSIDLVGQMIDFCASGYFKYPDFAEAVVRPHHDPQKTWRLDQYEDATALCMFVNMIAPVWNHVLEHPESLVAGYGRRLYEERTDLIKPLLLYSSFGPIVKSIRTMIDDRYIKFLERTTPILDRAEQAAAKDYIFSRILTRRLLVYDPIKLGLGGALPNIAVFIGQGVDRAVQNQRIKMTPQIITE